jgi:hypothetical protein
MIKNVTARIEVADIDEVLPLYEKLTGVSAQRSSRRGLDLAWLGSIVLLSGPSELLAEFRRAATLTVVDLQVAVDAVELAGGSIIEGPGPIPGGLRAIVRHPDGSVIEYLEREVSN